MAGSPRETQPDLGHGLERAYRLRKKARRIASRAYKEGRSVREVARELTDLSEEDLAY